MLMNNIFDIIVGPSINSSGSEGLPPWVYLLIIIGSVLLLLGVTLLIYFLNKKNKGVTK